MNNLCNTREKELICDYEEYEKDIDFYSKILEALKKDLSFRKYQKKEILLSLLEVSYRMKTKPLPNSFYLTSCDKTLLLEVLDALGYPNAEIDESLSNSHSLYIILNPR